MRHLHRWLRPIMHEIQGENNLVGGWFAAAAAGALFAAVDAEGVAYRYIEVGLES